MPEAIARRRQRRHLAAGLGICAGLALAFALARGQRPSASAQRVEPWTPWVEGLVGDVVTDLLTLGTATGAPRPMLFVADGNAMHRSVDGGRTWLPVELASPADRPALVEMVRAPADGSGLRVYAALKANPGLAFTTDAGQTWTLRSGPSGVEALDTLAATAGDRVYAAWGGLPALVAVTDDRGLGWRWQDLGRFGASGPVWRLAAADGGQTVYALVGRALFRSPDGGADWEPRGPVATEEPAARPWLLTAPDDRIYYAVAPDAGSDRLRFSPDAGASWRDLSLPEAPPARLTALAAGGLPGGGARVCAGFDTGAVHCSDDDGGGWQRLARLPVEPIALELDPIDGAVWAGTRGLGLQQLAPETRGSGRRLLEVVDVAAPGDPQAGLAFALAWLPRSSPRQAREALILRAEIGGAWRIASPRIPAGGRLLASPDFDSDGRIYAGRMRSTDAGATWEPFGDAPGGAPPAIAAIGRTATGQLRLLALEAPYVDGFGGNGLVQSFDDGQTWELLESGASGIVAVGAAPDDPDFESLFFMTDRGVVFRSEFGEIFDEVGRIPSALPLRGAYDLQISPGYVRDLSLLALAEQRVPADRLADRALVYRSQDGGQSWSPWGEGLPAGWRPRSAWLSPDFDIDGLAFLGGALQAGDPALPGFFRAQGKGLAASWQPETGLPIEAEVHHLSLGGLPTDGRLLAAAGQAGVWVRALQQPPPPSRTATPTRPPFEPTEPPPASPTAEPPASPTPVVSPDPGETPSATPMPTATSGAGTPPPSPTASASPQPSATPAIGRPRILLPYVARR
ncbi:MAG: hypothetical protein H6648_09500 [Caldilineae bacterium]|nr:hypothetical protein [Chloroflexota bacterium]MCB9177382.1 hypothetical protein [Caldilineae bacterium]